jgi:hypothetical protein
MFALSVCTSMKDANLIETENYETEKAGQKNAFPSEFSVRP